MWDQGALNPVLAELEALKLKLEDRLDMLASRLKRRKKMPKKLMVRAADAFGGAACHEAPQGGVHESPCVARLCFALRGYAPQPDW